MIVQRMGAGRVDREKDQRIESRLKQLEERVIDLMVKTTNQEVDIKKLQEAVFAASNKSKTKQ